MLKGPISLTALLIALLAAGLLVLQFFIFLITMHFRYEEQFRMAASDRARLAITMHGLLAPLEPAERVRLLADMNYESFSVSIAAERPLKQDGSDHSLFLLRRLVQLSELPRPGRNLSRAELLDSAVGDVLATRVDTFRVDWQLLPLFSQNLLSRDPRAGVFTGEAGLGFDDGTWLHVTYYTVPTLSGNLSDLLLELSVQFILQMVMAVAVIRYLMRPLRQLADFADRIIPDVPEEAPEGLPERGPSEVVRTSQAFRIMYERIKRHVQERMRLLAGISHDLRTPIARLRMQLESEPALRRPDLVFDALDDLQNLAEDAVSLARTGANSEPERKTDLAFLLESMAADYDERHSTGERSGEKPQLRLHVRLRPHCLLRPQAFRRCLENLVDNAFRYGGGAEIFLEPVADNPGLARIRIEDRGTGIPEAELENVFQPFYRLEHSRNHSTGGTGLGLSIARDLARLNHARLSLANREEGGLRAVLLVPTL